MENANLNTLVEACYSARNTIEYRKALEPVSTYFRDDFKRAVIKSSILPDPVNETSGIINFLPSGNKSRNEKEDVLIMDLLSDLDLPYDSENLYKYRDKIWRKTVSMIKDAA